MKVLDLFSGLGGWAKPWQDGGHDVVTLDWQEKFGCTITGDILNGITLASVKAHGPYDVILASPPCEGFSVAAIGRNWHRGGIPKTDSARTAQAILRQTLYIIEHLAPEWFVIENPRGMMRKMPELTFYDRSTVTYCQYGETRMKPTDLWHRMPEGFKFRPPCTNGSPCHEAAPRGARTGTQGIKGAENRSLIPADLAVEVYKAIQ